MPFSLADSAAMQTRLAPGFVAQTNLQLFDQLEAAGCDAETLDRAARAYFLGLQLVDGQYRASGKPFCNHLVGVASIVLQTGGTPEQVLAALIHAAYASGDFGDAGRGATPEKRAVVREAIGEAAEAIVYDYDQRATTDDVRFLHLANELEDNIDRGGGYVPHYSPEVLREMAAEAERLGHPMLARGLEEAADAVGAVVPAPFRRFDAASSWEARSARDHAVGLLRRVRRKVLEKVRRQ